MRGRPGYEARFSALKSLAPTDAFLPPTLKSVLKFGRGIGSNCGLDHSGSQSLAPTDAFLPPTAADDHQALIWDIEQMPQPIEVPILAYAAEGEINQVQWSSSQPDWIGICYRDNVEILRV